MIRYGEPCIWIGPRSLLHCRRSEAYRYHWHYPAWLYPSACPPCGCWGGGAGATVYSVTPR